MSFVDVGKLTLYLYMKFKQTAPNQSNCSSSIASSDWFFLWTFRKIIYLILHIDGTFSYKYLYHAHLWELCSLIFADKNLNLLLCGKLNLVRGQILPEFSCIFLSNYADCITWNYQHNMTLSPSERWVKLLSIKKRYISY